MIIDYKPEYAEDMKNLLEELQHYIASIDKEKHNIVSSDFKDYYFKETMDEVEKNNGRIFLMKDDNKIVGLVIGLINNENMEEPGFKAPKRGRVTELIVTKEYRSKGYGKILLKKMEDYLKSQGCQGILIEVFAYNESALNFYERNGYHLRMTEVTKINI